MKNKNFWLKTGTRKKIGKLIEKSKFKQKGGEIFIKDLDQVHYIKNHYLKSSKCLCCLKVLSFIHLKILPLQVKYLWKEIISNKIRVIRCLQHFPATQSLLPYLFKPQLYTSPKARFVAGKQC